MVNNQYRIGPINVECNLLNLNVKKAFEEYQSHDSCNADVRIAYGYSEIVACNKNHEHLSKEQNERIFTLQNYALQAIRFDLLVLHASVISLYGKAIIFCGERNAGKTTLAKLLEILYKNRAFVFADDRPVMGWKNAAVHIWNTPWSNHQNKGQKDKHIEVRAICYLRRSRRNLIVQLDNQSSINALLSYYPASLGDDIKRFSSRMIDSINSYSFEHTGDITAVGMIYDRLLEDSNLNN